MSSISFRGHNARLAYKLSGAHVAQLRCPQLVTSFGLNAEESQAKRVRAFYPHLRVQGTFAMRFDFINWAEFNQGMAWFRAYINSLIDARNPSPMVVRLDDRDFVRLGIPTTGVSFGDHTASMVFSPTITFVSVADPRDKKTSIIKTSQASDFSLPTGDPQAADWFYPDSLLSHPGQLQNYLYDRAVDGAADQAAAIQQTATGQGNGSPWGRGGETPVPQ